MSSLHQERIREFLDYLTFQKRYSPHTILSYQNDLNDFYKFIIDSDIQSDKEITPAMVRSWLASLMERKFSARTVNRKISALKSYFKYQLRLENITASPLADKKSLKISRRLPVFLEEKEVDKLLSQDQQTETWEEILSHIILVIFYQTGIRLSELLNLKEKDIDTYSSAIKVLGKGNKERIIPVSNDFLREITHYLEQKKKWIGTENQEYLLVRENGKALYPKYIYNMVRNRVGEIATIERKSPHVLRHTFATHLTNNGAPINAVKELLGHSSLAATQIYTHNSIEKLKEIYKQAHPKG